MRLRDKDGTNKCVAQIIIFHQNHLKVLSTLLETEDTAGDGLFMISPLSVTLKGKPANEARKSFS